MVCLHHDDMDGFCSGGIVYNYHKKKGEKVSCYSCSHSTSTPLDKIKKGEKVYIVDFSLSIEGFNKLLEITEDVIWIDHHKSVIDKVKDTNISKLKGIRRVGEAGCELTWEFFYGKGKEVKIPTMVRMLGRYDVWDFSLYGKKTLNSLQEYCKTVDSIPESDIWEKWLDTSYSPEEEIEIGGKYLHYRDSIWDSYLKKWGFEADFEGYRIIACNISNVNSEFFKSVAYMEYDILVPFASDGSKWSFSLYTLKPSIDCSKIAAKYGGGGHKNASGFTHNTIPFLDENK